MKYICVSNGGNNWWKIDKIYREIDGFLERESHFSRSLYPASIWNNIPGVKFVPVFDLYLKQVELC